MHNGPKFVDEALQNIVNQLYDHSTDFEKIPLIFRRGFDILKSGNVVLEDPTLLMSFGSFFGRFIGLCDENELITKYSPLVVDCYNVYLNVPGFKDYLSTKNNPDSIENISNKLFLLKDYFVEDNPFEIDTTEK
ncbi:hypothetical protein KY334_01845 [Candidatus Woesearchaeota archaeon]|nr:hypothetical protein [Candidatus Woesearchaeota archaeon]